MATVNAMPLDRSNPVLLSRDERRRTELNLRRQDFNRSASTTFDGGKAGDLICSDNVMKHVLGDRASVDKTGTAETILDTSSAGQTEPRTSATLDGNALRSLGARGSQRVEFDHVTWRRSSLRSQAAADVVHGDGRRNSLHCNTLASHGRIPGHRSSTSSPQPFSPPPYATGQRRSRTPPRRTLNSVHTSPAGGHTSPHSLLLDSDVAKVTHVVLPSAEEVLNPLDVSRKKKLIK